MSLHTSSSPCLPRFIHSFTAPCHPCCTQHQMTREKFTESNCSNLNTCSTSINTIFLISAIIVLVSKKFDFILQQFSEVLPQVLSKFPVFCKNEFSFASRSSKLFCSGHVIKFSAKIVDNRHVFNNRSSKGRPDEIARSKEDPERSWMCPRARKSRQ